MFDEIDSFENVLNLFSFDTYDDIVYTSKNSMLRRLFAFQTRQVAKMNYDKASKLLLKFARLNISSKNYQKQKSIIVEKFKYFAFAINQVDAYITSDECRFDDFLNVFNAHRQHLFQNDVYKKVSKNDRAIYVI